MFECSWKSWLQPTRWFYFLCNPTTRVVEVLKFNDSETMCNCLVNYYCITLIIFKKKKKVWEEEIFRSFVGKVKARMESIWTDAISLRAIIFFFNLPKSNHKITTNPILLHSIASFFLTWEYKKQTKIKKFGISK